MTTLAKQPRKAKTQTTHPDVSDGTQIVAPLMRRRELIEIDKIVDDGHNHRLASKADAVAIQELADSMRVDGLLQPILVYTDVGGDFHRIYGHRRVEAAKLLGWATIPADVMGRVPEESEKHRLRAMENLRRKNLNAAEEAIAVHELVESHSPIHGHEKAMERAGADLGRDLGWVKDRLYIVERLTKKVRELVAAGMINMAQARELAKVGDEKVQERFAKDIADRLAPGNGSYSAQGGRIVSVQEIRGWIDNETHSLRGVAWKIELPFAGKPACVGCQHNTATDATLFETSKEDAEKGAAGAGGCCTNAGCFDVKVRKVGEAQTKAIEKIKGMVKAKEVAKEDAGSAEVVRGVVPVFVRPEAVQRRVKAEVPGASTAKKDIAVNGPKGAEGPAGAKSDKEKRQEALKKWGRAFSEWRGDIGDKIDDVCKAQLTARAVGNLIEASETLESIEPYSHASGDHDFSTYGSFKAEVKPRAEDPMTPSVAKFLRTMKEAIATPLDPIWAALVEDSRRSGVSIFGLGPEMTKRFADVFGVECPPVPVFEDFLPDDLKPSSAKASPKGAGDSAANLKLGANEHGVFTKPETIEVKFPKPWKLQVGIDVACDTQGLFHLGYHRSLPGYTCGAAPSVKGESFETRTMALEAACMDAETWIASELKSKPNVVLDAKKILREAISVANELPASKTKKPKAIKSPAPAPAGGGDDFADDQEGAE